MYFFFLSRFVCKNSIEESIIELQDKKLQMSEDILAITQNTLTMREVIEEIHHQSSEIIKELFNR